MVSFNIHRSLKLCISLFWHTCHWSLLTYMGLFWHVRISLDVHVTGFFWHNVPFDRALARRNGTKFSSASLFCRPLSIYIGLFWQICKKKKHSKRNGAFRELLFDRHMGFYWQLCEPKRRQKFNHWAFVTVENAPSEQYGTLSKRDRAI